MKRYFLLFIVFSVVVSLWAQPTLLVEQGSLLVTPEEVPESGQLELAIGVTNETEFPMNVYVTRSFVDTVSPFNYPFTFGNEGAYERFCWGPPCFNFGTDASPTISAFLVSLGPGQSTDSFYANYVPNGITGESTFRYCFVPLQSPTLSSCADLTFGVAPSVVILGCTAESALNFDPEATEDDGSCDFVEFGCADIGQPWWEGEATGIFTDAASWTAGEAGIAEAVLHVGTTVSAFAQEIQVNAWTFTGHEGLPLGLSLTLDDEEGGPNVQSCFGLSGVTNDLGLHEVTMLFEVETSVFGGPYLVENVPLTLVIEVLPNPCGGVGCTLPAAENYNPDAVIDDGSCFLAGCTDEDALNFHPAFTFDNGTCTYSSDFESDCLMDGDGDGSIGVGDLLTLLTMFGITCQL